MEVPISSAGDDNNLTSFLFADKMAEETLRDISRSVPVSGKVSEFFAR